MSFKVNGRAASGSGLGSFAMSQRELTDELHYYLDRLRAGEFMGNEFSIEWDPSDEPHVFTRDPSITDARICRICDDTEKGNEKHVPERRVTGSATRR